MMLKALFALSTLTTAYTLNLYDQCGGINYSGSTTCPSGSHCEYVNDYYHQCLPGSPSPADPSPGDGGSQPTLNLYDQCGGINYNGLTTCPSGSHCEYVNDYYYQCLPGSSPPSNPPAEPPSNPPAEPPSNPPAEPPSNPGPGDGGSPGIPGGFSGNGVTTRYWDCCKPSCSWNGKSSHVNQPVFTCDSNGNRQSDFNIQSGCIGGSAYMCSDQTPWAVNNSLSYGFAAASLVGGSEDSACCTCMKLTFTSGPVSGKQMIVQLTNTGSDLGSNHFDLAIPGGGFGIFTQGCPSQFGSGYSWGAQYGGISNAADCNGLPQSLQAGCNWRFNWFQNADNPSVSFVQVACPQAITDKTGCHRTDE